MRHDDGAQHQLGAGQAEHRAVGHALLQRHVDERAAGRDVERLAGERHRAADRLAAHREADAEPLVAAPLLELGARDVDVQRRQRVLDVEHQHRHPDETAAGDAVQHRRPGPEPVELRRRLGQHAPARDVGVHDAKPVEHLAALRQHGRPQVLDQLLGRGANAGAAIEPDELIGQRFGESPMCLSYVWCSTSCRNVLASRGGYILIMALWIPSALYADATFDRWAQDVVSLVTWALLAAVFLAVDGHERRQLVVVVVVATLFEITFSIIWGLYVYRFENLPLYVPPGPRADLPAGAAAVAVPVRARQPPRHLGRRDRRPSAPGWPARW